VNEPLQVCEHEHVTRLRPLYVDGRPLFTCNQCGARLTYEDDEPSHKALTVVEVAD
jgi:transposase-like protein